jgi:hypothetical protein
MGSGYDFLPIPNHLRIFAKRLDTRRVYAASPVVRPTLSYAVDAAAALYGDGAPRSLPTTSPETPHSKRCASTLSMMPYSFASSAVKK